MRRGAKSKRLEHSGSAFKVLACRLSGDAAIANCHKVGRDGAAATGGACVRKLLLKVLLYSMGDRVYLDWECDTPLRP